MVDIYYDQLEDWYETEEEPKPKNRKVSIRKLVGSPGGTPFLFSLELCLLLNGNESEVGKVIR